MLLLLSSCEWGPAFFDLGDVDEDDLRDFASDRGALAAFNRMDFFGEPRADVEVDCRNEHAEACTLWIGSALSRGRAFVSNDDPAEIDALIRHEIVHVSLWEQPNHCASHSPDCGWRDP